MANTIFDRPDLSVFTRLDDLGLEVTGQRVEADHAVLACRITGEDRWCRRRGCQCISRGTVVRRLAHEPCGWRPTIVHVSVRRYRCSASCSEPGEHVAAVLQRPMLPVEVCRQELLAVVLVVGSGAPDP